MGFFTGVDEVIYSKITSFYRAENRLPTKDEFLAQHDEEIVSYCEVQIFEETPEVAISDDYLVSLLQDDYIR